MYGCGPGGKQKGGAWDVGLVARVVARLFVTAAEHVRRMNGIHVSFRASCLEIYNEELRDLTEHSQTPLTIRENPDFQQHSSISSKASITKSACNSLLYKQTMHQVSKSSSPSSVNTTTEHTIVQGLRQHEVTSPEQMMELFEYATAARSTGTTQLNDTSSRSHAILTITVTQTRTVLARSHLSFRHMCTSSKQ